MIIKSEKEFEKAISRMQSLLELIDPSPKQQKELDELLEAIQNYGDNEPEFMDL